MTVSLLAAITIWATGLLCALLYLAYAAIKLLEAFENTALAKWMEGNDD